MINPNALDGLTAAERATGLAGYLASFASLKRMALNGYTRGLAEEQEASLLLTLVVYSKRVDVRGFCGGSFAGIVARVIQLVTVPTSDHSDSGNRSDSNLSNDSAGMSPWCHRSDGEFGGTWQNQDECGGSGQIGHFGSHTMQLPSEPHA